MSPEVARGIAAGESTLILLMWSIWSIGYLRLLVARAVAWTCIPFWAVLDLSFLNGLVHHYELHRPTYVIVVVMVPIILALVYALRKSPRILLNMQKR